MESAYRRLVNRAVVPGFRKGKAPRAVIERYFGRSALLEDAIEHLAPTIAQDAIAEQSIEAISQPRLEVTQVDPVIVKATVDVAPAITLGDYQALRTEAIEANVTDEDFTKAMDSLRDHAATWEPVERPVELGDMLTLDFAITENGNEVAKQSDLTYTAIESRRDPLPGFVNQVVGMTVEEPKSFQLTFDDDNEDEYLKGKTFDVTATIHDIKGKVLPALDDDFAKTVGEGFDSLADLEARVRENLRIQAEADALEKTRESALTKLSETADLEVPFGMVESEIDSILSDREQALLRQGIRFEDYLRIMGSTIETLRDEIRADARERVRRRLILQQLAELENIEADVDEINNEIAETIRNSGASSAEVSRLLDQPAARESVARNIRVRKALARLVDITTEGKVTYPTEPPAEQPAEPEAEGEAAASAESEG